MIKSNKKLLIFLLSFVSLSLTSCGSLSGLDALASGQGDFSPPSWIMGGFVVNDSTVDAESYAGNLQIADIGINLDVTDIGAFEYSVLDLVLIGIGSSGGITFLETSNTETNYAFEMTDTTVSPAVTVKVSISRDNVNQVNGYDIKFTTSCDGCTTKTSEYTLYSI